eukprot:1146583-Pelagomonas_calceolata.AAC.5
MGITLARSRAIPFTGKFNNYFKDLAVVRSVKEVRSSTTPDRQLQELNIQNRHIHLIEIKYCEDMRPGVQLEASQQQHSELCKQLQGADITLHTILLGMGGTI